MNYGKCHQYVNFNNGIQCRCFSFRASPEGHQCDCCKHDINYHEPQQIHPSATTREFDVYDVDAINKNNRKKNKNKDFEADVINISAESAVGPNPKIPRDGIGQMLASGKMKQVRFTEDTSVETAIETSFSELKGQRWQIFCLRDGSISDLIPATVPDGGWKIEDLKAKKICGSRKKIYVGVLLQPEPEFEVIPEGFQPQTGTNFQSNAHHTNFTATTTTPYITQRPLYHHQAGTNFQSDFPATPYITTQRPLYQPQTGQSDVIYLTQTFQPQTGTNFQQDATTFHTAQA